MVTAWLKAQHQSVEDLSSSDLLMLIIVRAANLMGAEKLYIKETPLKIAIAKILTAKKYKLMKQFLFSEHGIFPNCRELDDGINNLRFGGTVTWSNIQNDKELVVTPNARHWVREIIEPVLNEEHWSEVDEIVRKLVEEFLIAD